MKWDAQRYQSNCGGVTEHGKNLVNILRDQNCGHVLDLGCGTGVLTAGIASFAGKVIGVDASAEMIGRAKAAYPHIPFAVKDACSLGWDSQFDAVFSNAVFHFIADQDSLLQGIYNALKPGGILLCEFGAHGNLRDLLAAMESACVKRGKPYPLRFYYPTGKRYREKVASHGFRVELLETYDLDTPLQEGESGLRNWLTQIFATELSWFPLPERQEVLAEIEEALRPSQWDGTRWHMANRRLRLMARKA